MMSTNNKSGFVVSGKGKYFTPSSGKQHTANTSLQEARLKLIHDPDVLRHLELRASEEHRLFVHAINQHKQLHMERDKVSRLCDPVAIQKQIITITNRENNVKELHRQLAILRNETAVLHAKISGGC
jgi:hypothetical protein